MTRLEALRELAAKVEAGELHDIASDTVSNAGLGDFEWALDDIAEVRSLDAALAIHKAVLPGWLPVIDMIECNIGMHIQILDYDGQPCDEWLWQFEVKFSDNPARAWFLSILRALIAQEEGQ